MRVKVATISFLFIDLFLFLTAGFYLASTPLASATKHDRMVFVVRSYIIVAALLISLFTTVILVWVWMRRLREEFRDQAKQNLASLIEGTLQDHESKKT